MSDHNPPSAWPEFIYSYKYNSGRLYRTNLTTDVKSVHKVPAFQFKLGTSCSELHGGCLLLTGGGDASREVVKIDTLREFAVSYRPPMLIPRQSHTAIYHANLLYILGGLDENDAALQECERYVCLEGRWEALPPLPRAAVKSSGVVAEGRLYVIGGCDDAVYLDVIQRLCLERLTRELLELRLPHADCSLGCFVKDSAVYVLLSNNLYSFSPHTLQLQRVKTLPQVILSCIGPSYYTRGTLYCGSSFGAARTVVIGSLDN